MLATGAPLRNWTFLLLLCSSSTLVSADTAANETVTTKSSATGAYPGATTHHTSHATSVPLPSPSPLSTRRYSDSESTSPYRTINYITHTLPQQCAKTSWSAPGETAVGDGTAVEAGALAGLQTAIPGIWEGPDSITKDERRNANSEASSQPGATGSAPSATPSGTEGVQPELELEVDSPFDNANFLSFEEWKKKNLAKVGQSPENVGQGRPAASNQAPRRRPVNVNALDSLGDEGEISIDFSGFGRPEDGGVANSVQQVKQNAEATKAANGQGKVAPGSFALSKDAGKTCKERFNYASFDCAATVLKTNKQAKSSSAILVENKDSYMLNICSADNKFLIVELCDDILVDTVVLANYEFFSSMFRHFRVSVSDRYPVKMEKWRTLGTFEARNSRDIQPFLITEPQIWARYLRIEFLTQFGNEYYCPLSLLRVHGTTMLEQFRQEEEEARGIDDEEDLEAEGVDVKKPAADSGPLPLEEIPIEALKDDGAKSVVSQTIDANQESTSESHVETGTTSSSEMHDSSTVANEQFAGQATDRAQTQQASEQRPTSSPTPTGNSKNSNTSATGESKAPTAPSTIDKAEASPLTHGSVTGSPVTNISPSNDIAAASSAESSASASPSSSLKASNNGTVVPSQPQSPGRGSATQPNAPTPSTQESFFKSIHKRLQYLEANSTLSLQYIEEQSRALRDAFIKTEKRQLAKTEKFLDHLNSTVMIELRSFRNMYDQLWQSTVIELESMKERQKSEMGEISTRLSLLADELVWQKRMAVVQSTLLLLCLGLVLFVRSGTLGSSADVPIVHQLGSKYTSFFETSPSRSPPNISGMARRRSTLRNMWRSDTSAGLSDHHSDSRHAMSDAETDGLRSPTQDDCPDTPIARRESSSSLRLLDSRDTTPVRHHNHHHHQENLSPAQTPDDQAVRIQVLATQSGPATPNGTRDSRPSWEEVDRAIDLLKAEEHNQSPPSPNSRHKDRGGKKKKRSPLRRAHSNFESVGDDETEGGK